MSDRLERLKAKTDRANQHIQELDKAIHLFVHSHPYDVSIEHDLYSREFKWTLNRADPIPLPISTIAGDAIQNLRSVLDHLVYQLIDANGNNPIDGVSGFPIVPSAKEYATAKCKRKIEGVRQEAADAIDKLKPYRSGNETLWRLHSLNNIDKHRLLISAGSNVMHHTLLRSQRAKLVASYLGSYPNATSAPDLDGDVIKPTTARFPLKVGEVFLTVPDAEMEQNFTFTLGVAFNEPGVVQGETIIETVKHFADFVGNVIPIFGPLLN